MSTGDGRWKTSLKGLEQFVDALTDVATQSGASWRVPADAADHVYDKLVDRILADSCPRGPHAWACRVLFNTIKKGPECTDLMRWRFESVAIELVASAGESDCSLHAVPSVRDVPPEVLRDLTGAERRAFAAVLEVGSMREAATCAGMTKRDLRIRVTRIAAKLRARWSSPADRGRLTAARPGLR